MSLRSHEQEMLHTRNMAVKTSTNELARYIAAYVNEELARRHKITYQTILDAIDAFEGDAR